MGLMQRFKREIRSANGKQLAFDVKNGYGAALGGLFERIARGKVKDSEIRDLYGVSDDDSEAMRARYQAGPRLTPSSGTSGKYTALLSLHGVALYDLEYQPYAFSTLLLSQQLDALAADPMVDQIVLDINTPGGHVTGTQEAADAVWNARKKKPVIGIVNPLCASAGYWIGSQCSKLIGVPSADIGSIGVFMTHYDCSAMLANEGIKPTFIYAGEHKVEGNNMEPLGAEALAWFQAGVDDTYKNFLAAVARGRGITSEKVLADFGKGRCYDAPMAKRVGMIDEIAPIKLALKSCGLTMEMPQEVGRRRSEAVQTDENASASLPDAETSNESDQVAGDEPAAAVLDESGCEAVVITEVRSAGSLTLYSDRPWPARMSIAAELLNGSAPVNIVGVAGDTVTFSVANGAAVYTKIGCAANGNWICALEPGSHFEPPPGAASTAPAEAVVEPDFKAAAEAMRHRIALLSA